MQSVKEQVTDFLNKCEELKICKFIVAPTKIKDLLKSIVNSAELYELFNTVSSGFDYLAAKKRCLVTISDGITPKSYLALPETVGDRLAFIFCLLVELDKDTINLNWFLQTYFADDGSYFSSYHAFCDVVICTLEQIIREVFEKELYEEEIVMPEPPTAIPEKTGSEKLLQLISDINLLIAQEKQFILESNVVPEEKEVGYKILSQLGDAVKNYNSDLINALAIAYNYYALYNNLISGNLQSLFEALHELGNAI